MTFKELQAYYKTGYQFHQRTGMSATAYGVWKRNGVVPELSQLKIEKLTKGELKADWDE